ncbi:helix-turn-helix domain-containing protein [Streptomyces sp. RGM 3693]|uniref:helix-turn-helix domain-containing protein n=1 Tax=Streptomyces sp. RGM 3693 TaxID=3413284 RepID=UPI003D2E1570
MCNYRAAAVAAPHQVAVLALAPVAAFDLSIPAQMLATVESRAGFAAYHVRTATPDGSAVPTANGYGVTPQGDLSLLEHADTVIVAGTRSLNLLDDGALDARIAETLRAAAQRRARMVSLCTGAFVLAAHCHMSVRTFTRRFRQETGLSPSEWFTSARLKHARHLLESTDLPVDDIAAKAGLGSGTNLRQHMRITLDTTPSAYRRAFRSTTVTRHPR